MTPKRSLTLHPYSWVRALAALAAASGLMAQIAPTAEPATASPRDEAAPVVERGPGATRANEEVVTLSPFEVTASTRGYFSVNTMSGTRFNTKVEDLGSSLTVVTKEQMQDFAMLDINDIFLYTANTEGIGTYTDYVVDRNGQLTDNVQINPTQANRVRGIAAANISYGNFETQGRMPIDPLIIDGIEVSRGPNANVFGLGFSAGTVNQVPVSANVTREFTKAEARLDSYQGYRTSLDANRVLRQGVLAIRVSGAFQHEGFQRKPSGVNTVRYNGMVKFQPFPSTTISAAYLHYKMNGNRPNYTPPRDYVSSWLDAGGPGWDPVAQVVHVNGQTLGPFTSDASVPRYFSRVGTMQTRSNLFIDQGGLAYWTAPNTNSMTAAFRTPAANNQTVRLMQSGLNLGTQGAPLGRYTDQPLFGTTPSVSRRDIYDWSEVNISSVNRLMDRTDAYNVQLDHLFFNTPFHSLAVQVGFFREDSQRYQRTPIGNSSTSGQSGQLFIDVNEKLLDGSPNPFFGRPYIGATEPITRLLPQKWDSYRAQFAYKLDFRNEKSWLRWLGLQQISGYDEYKYRVSRSYGFRDVLASDHSWTVTGSTGFAANQARGNQSNITNGPQAGANIVRGYFRYYVGDNVGGNIDYAPGDFRYGYYPFVWGGYTSVSGGIPNATTGTFIREPALLTQLATTDQTSQSNNLKQIIKTPGIVVQSHFWNDKFVTTLGLRQDRVYSKNGTPLPLLSDNNTTHDYDQENHWTAGDYMYSGGRTKTVSFVLRPFGDIKALADAANGSGLVSWLADAVRGLAFTYNKSNNFFPQPPAVDLYLNPLPNITGEGKDYGLWLNMADGKFVLRYNHYNTKQLNARDSDANTVAQRVLRLDLDISNDAYQLYDRATAWWSLTQPQWSADQVRQAVADQMQIPIPIYDALYTNFRANTIAATNDVVAKGDEIEVNFNPSRYWTVSGSVTKQESIASNISDAVQRWIDQRMPVWTSVVDQNTNPNLGTGQSQGWVDPVNNPDHLWWTHNYGGSQTAEQNFGTFVDATYRLIKAQDGRSKPSVRKYNFRISSSYQLAGVTEHPIMRDIKVGGALRWEDKGAIGYYGLQQLPARITEYDPNRPIWDKSHYYVDAFISYRTKLFRDRVGATFQLNARSIGENGRLQPIGAFPDGTANAFRIIDPQQFIFTATFDL